jgi:hypothetical protein
MFDFLKTKSFDMVFSFLLGLSCMTLLKPICQGKDCQLQKAPSVDEVKSSTYQIGSKCYQFAVQHLSDGCPNEGVIEPFERFIR